MSTKLTFKKEERLCNKIILDRLYNEGKSVFVYPFKFIFLPFNSSGNFPIQVVFSVPKRSFKQAVKRNLIRRRMREAYRLNKNDLYDALKPTANELALMIIYVEKEIKDYKLLEKGMIKGLKKLKGYYTKA